MGNNAGCHRRARWTGLFTGAMLSIGGSMQAQTVSPNQPLTHDIRVQIVAETSTVIGAPMTGRLSAFPLRDGMRFKQGDLLARFVCDEQQGAMAKARAILQGKQAALSTNRKLNQLGTSSVLEGELAEAAASEAQADVAITEAAASRCSISAPFPGRVASIAVRPFQFVSAGTPMLEILDDQSLNAELILPSSWLMWIKPGTPFKIAVDETGNSYNAAIIRLSGKVDAVSQSIKVYGHITDTTTDLLPGMSGHAVFNPPAGK